jgi:nitroreductase
VILREDQVDAVAEAARWAPSIHNSQPWRLRRRPDGIAVLEDEARAVSVIDPLGRDRVISCGAAVLNARVALRANGFTTATDLLPDPANPAVIGVVRAIGRADPSPCDEALSQAVTRRRTHRRVYRSHAVSESDLLDLYQATSAEGARLSVADPASRRRLAHLLRRAVREQAADAELRAEVETWVRRGSVTTSTAVEGIPRPSLGTSPYPVDSLVHGGPGEPPAAEAIEDELARSTVLVISTRGDGRRDWVIAGLGLEHLLLTATSRGLVATFADQALQVTSLRPEVAELLGIWGHPQVMLRIGRAITDAPRTPRRPLRELMG